MGGALMANDLATALANLKEQDVYQAVDTMLADKVDPGEILAACQEGIRMVGDRYEAGEYFISELVMSGVIFKAVVAKLEPLVAGRSADSRGSVVVGTVQGDIHDIGKDLVVSTMRAAGYDVTDLGVNVAPETFVQALRDTGATVLGLSGLLTVSFDPMGDTVRAVEKAGLRDTVKIMVGGGPVTDWVREQAGADALGANPPAAVRLADAWTKEKS
jgi:methylmalonyl-CoA mutase cobalamin-binding domain/chain